MRTEITISSDYSERKRKRDKREAEPLTCGKVTQMQRRSRVERCRARRKTVVLLCWHAAVVVPLKITEIEYIHARASTSMSPAALVG